MADTLQSPQDLLHLQLRTALTMEDDSLAALGELANAAATAEVRKLFTHHADETREQISNLHKVVELLELDAIGAPSPSTKGIMEQAKKLIDLSDPAVRDRVVLSSALGNEHYEIAAYQALIVPLQKEGMSDAVDLLSANLEQEQHTSGELKDMLEKISG